jgi:hypothetical protein
MRTLLGTSLVKILAVALSIACTQSASAQHFKRVNVTGGRRLVQIASGGASVWARATNGNPYIFKGGTFVLASSISLTQIAVGGGNAVQADGVWGLDSSGRIYHAHLSGTSWVFSRVPGALDFIAVGIGYQDNCHPYEVWGLNPAAQIFRYNFCARTWDQVPGTLGTLAVGSGDIWGINGNGNVFWFNFASLNFDPIRNQGYQAVQIAVGQTTAWVLASPPEVVEIIGDESVQGFDFSPSLAQVQAGENGVWAIDSSQQVFRFDQATNCLCHMQGALASISVGGGGGVWGINGAGQPLAFTTP